MEVAFAFISSTVISSDIVKPITITAGSKAVIFLRAASESGLFFSESKNLQGSSGDVEEENNDI